MKRTLAFDSQHRIGVSTISRELLTVDQSVCRWNFKNCDLRNVFASVLATSRDMTVEIWQNGHRHSIQRIK